MEKAIGSPIRAALARPPSPEAPAVPVPAIVVIVGTKANTVLCAEAAKPRAIQKAARGTMIVGLAAAA
jgi:hypothetical protein